MVKEVSNEGREAQSCQARAFKIGSTKSRQRCARAIASVRKGHAGREETGGVEIAVVGKSWVRRQDG